MGDPFGVSEPSAGQRRGRWTLVRPIGHGGNADVWLGRHGDQEAALKILRRSNPATEPYQRFVREIDVLGQLKHDPGVLPLIDSQLPRGERPYFSMPIAETSAAALVDASTEAIVECARDIAQVLVRLLSTQDIKHRDLKPTNLYRFNASWVVGDFGLIEIPSLDTLTARDRFVGPAYFVAFDVMQDPDNADYAAGDVFSLAKTLWVLLVGQRWPAPGPHRADRGIDSLYLLRPHRHAEALDRALAAATERNPDDRLTMEQFASELTAWLALDRDGPEPLADDLSDITARLRRRLAEDVSQSEREAQWRRAALEDEAYLLAALPAFYEELRRVRADFTGQTPDGLMQNLLGRASDDGLLWESISTSRLEGPGEYAVSLRMGRSIHLYRGGAVRCQGGYSLGVEGESAQQQWSTFTDPAPAGSLASRQEIDNLTMLLRSQLGQWLELFATAL